MFLSIAWHKGLQKLNGNFGLRAFDSNRMNFCGVYSIGNYNGIEFDTFRACDLH